MKTMLVTKNDNANTCPISAETPSAMSIEISATATGMNAATNVPKTRIKMISAAGIPNVSPLFRSSCPTSSKSLPIVAWPVRSTSNALSAFARSTISRMSGWFDVASSKSPAMINGMIVVRLSSETNPSTPVR